LVGSARRVARFAAALARLLLFAFAAFGLTAPAAAQTSQTITFTAPQPKTYGNAPFTVNATASSGLTVSFASLTIPVCTVSGTMVTLVAAGTCTIQASQAGNATYAPAPNVSRNISVAKAAQTITFVAPTGKTYGDSPFTVSATASSGLAVTFVSTTTAVCTVSGTTVTIIAAGTCTIQSQQAGNGNYNAAANVSHSFTVAKSAQTITFAPANQTFGVAPFAVSATASSGLAVTFSSLTTAVCTVSGSTVTIKAAGTCTLQAAQAGNGNYNAATNVSKSFTVAKAAQTITFVGPTGKTYGNSPFTVSATASSGLAVTFSSTTTTVCTVSGTTVTLVAAGTCTIQAAQAGNGNYSAAPNVSPSFTVAQASQTISLAAIPQQVVGIPATLSATASSGLAVSFSSLTSGICTVSGVTLTLVAAGSCTVQAAQAGNANYSAAPNVSRSFGVITAVQFAAQVTYPVGAYPWGVASGDFNGDGKPDLAVVNSSDDTISLFLGDGAGNLVAGSVLHTSGSLSYSIVVGDFNGDGKLDLAVGNLVSQNVSIFLGNGDGTFSGPTLVAVGGEPVNLAVADVNHDGKLDLIVVDGSTGSTTGQTVEVLLGNGDGTFHAGVPYTTGPGPIGVAVGDFNGDGKLDLAVTNSGNNTVSILLGNGDGTFQAAANYATQFYPEKIAVADFNGDGKADLVILNSRIGSFSVFLGNGDGTFGAGSNVGAGSAPQGLAIADFNGDGKLDLAIADSFGNDVMVYLGVGDGTFHAPVLFTTGTYPAGVAAVDLNRDGKIDLAVANYQSNTVSVLLNTSNIATAASVTAVTGTPQSAPINTAYATALSVIVKDSGNNPLPGAVVTFAAPTSGASGTFSGGAAAQVTTNSSGVATASTFTANGLGGAFTVLATAGSASAPFALTNTGGGNQAPAFTSGPAPNGNLSSAYAFTLTASGTPAPTFSVTANALPPGLGLNGTSGLINGTPTTTGTYAGMFTAANTVLPNATQTFAITIAGAAQTITFTAPGNNTYGAMPFTVSATASSGLAVSFASLTTSVCTVSGATVTLLAVGTCTIQASQAGNASYAPAPNVSRSFTVAQATQTITFVAPGNTTYGATPFAVSATASSGLAVSFASLTTNVCTVSVATVTIVAAGSCTIQASQVGNANYAAAASVSRSFTIAQATQTIAFGSPGNQILGVAPFTLNATASSGLVVSFASLTTPVCTVSGSTLTIVAVGTCTIQASQAGGTNYLAAPNVPQSFTVVADQPPTVALVQPANNSTYVAPAIIPLYATASDAIGPVTKVEFYNGSTLLATATAAPYTYSWSNVAAGSYTLTAKAYDNAGGKTTSVAVAIVVSATGSAVSFSHTADYPTTDGSTTPSDLVAGDFHGAGKLDLVVSLSGSNPLLVLHGDGNGNFPSTNYTGSNASGAVSAVTGDFNHDGKLDVALVNAGGVVAVLLGHGDGTFSNGAVYPVSAAAKAIAVGDFNGDGKLDLATANADGKVSLLLGNGDGTFQTAVSFAAGTGLQGIAAGDFNGDGKLDLVVTNPADRSIDVLLGNGNGTFQAPIHLITGTGLDYPYNVVVGDFNGDGKLDIAITDYFAPNVTILLGNGDGTFRPPFDFPAGAYPTGLVVADFNGDGKLDLAVTNTQQTNTVSVLLGNSNGSFRAPVTYALGADPGPLVAADLNGDGKPDLAVLNYFGGSLGILINTSGVTVQAPAFTSGPLPDGMGGVPYSFTFTASGVPAPSFTLTSANFQSNQFWLASNGTLASGSSSSSQPAAPGIYTGVVTASNGVAPAATQAFTLYIAREDQTITFAPLPDQPVNSQMLLAGSGPPAATASSGLPVSFVSLTPEICGGIVVALPDIIVQLFAVGSCVIRAEQPGNGYFAPAPSVDRSFAVLPTIEIGSASVGITAPIDGANFVAPATITFTASAFTNYLETSIYYVSYTYDGNYPIGTSAVRSPPYSVTWSNVPVGTHTVTAHAALWFGDPAGSNGVIASTVDSKPITIAVTAAPDQPVVALTAPAANSAYVAPASIALAATASDPSTSIARVEFYAGATLLGTASTTPYTFTWTNAPAGTFVLTARAVNSVGAAATSQPITVYVDSGIATPVALYSFNDTWDSSGLVLDFLGGFDGIRSGSLTQVTAPAVAPKPDTCQAASFAGGTIDIDDLPVPVIAGAKVTVAFWMNWTGGSGEMPLSWATQGLLLSGGNFGFTTQNGDVYGIAAASVANGWHYIVAEFTNNSVANNHLWIDGVAQSLTQRTGAPNNANAVVSTSLRLGGQSGTTNDRFLGQLDEVELFTDVLTAPHVAALYATANACASKTLQLIAPYNSASYYAPASIELAAVAIGAITGVQFYNGANPIGTATSALPFGFTWNNVQPGTYTLTGRSSDGTVTSNAVTVTVVAVGGGPTISESFTNGGTTFYSAGIVQIEANPTAAPGYDVVSVEFFANGVQIGIATGAPYTFTWRNPAPGTYTITTVVIDDAGVQVTSAPFTITVLAGSPSVVYYYNDVAGSPIAATDGSGNLLWDENYWPYGERFLHEDAVTQDGLWYTGKPVEDSTGLSYFGGRWYNPQIGRFYSVDPQRFRVDSPLTFNRYSYGNNNPYRYIDPDGRNLALLVVGGSFLVAASVVYIVNCSGCRQNIADGARWLADKLSNITSSEDGSEGNETPPPATAGPAPDTNASGDRGCNNPFGCTGKPDHQDKVRELGNRARDEAEDGEEVLENKKLQGFDSNRRPDQQIVDKNGRARQVYEAERNPNGSRNRAREAEYNRLGVPNQTFPLDP
jgi:RHS repeat-associated protein